MEPDAEFYRPFLEPLLSKPNTRLVPHSGILWNELQTAMGYLEHQVEQPRSSPSVDPQRNDTLLVTANLSYFPKRRFRNFDSIAVLVLYQLLTSVRFGSLFQKYGLVRMLIWVNDDDKRTFLPRCLQNRKKSALQAEFACEWLAEVAGKDPASLQVAPEQLRKLYLRDRWINIDSTREALARAEANGIGLPPAHRRMELTEEVIKTYKGRTKSAAEAAHVGPSYIERPYMAELEALDRAAQAGELNADDHPKEWARRSALRAQATKQEKWTVRFQELLQELAELSRLRASGELTEAELAAREAAYNEQVQDLGKNPLIDFRLLRDNAHVYRQTPPVLLWDRRPWEPLRVAEDEFFPNVEATLLDVQPKAMHRLLRDAGPGSCRAGDMFDLIQRSMLTTSLEPVSASLEKLWPGAREGILERCPSLRDPARGGLAGDGHAGVCARVLNETQWMEILEGFMAWPFRPTYAELIGRHGDDMEMPEPEGQHGPEFVA
ncbi:hypothetical protein ACRALDRAFT_1065411 [Sodiomyces alcalophilus JCM 7366]|uniref:uncharacterized protein n=1 Tax=Sodiomyces alcalophilus JCM 7366 TaxID=591952 RepID=UPI0039B3D733